MIRYPGSDASETYKLKLQMFENGKPEEFLQMMKYSMTGTDRTGITSAPGNIQFICAMLGRGALREFDFIASHVGSKINGHLKQIKEGLLSYPLPSPLNLLNKHKRTIMRAIRKP